MTSASSFLAVAAFAAPASAQHVNPEVTLYDQPQQQDFFFSFRRGLVPDAFATGSIARPGATSFYGAHHYAGTWADDDD